MSPNYLKVTKLGRKTYGFAKRVEYLDDQCEVDKTFYDFCRKHRGL
jgi:hypothetical protein